MTVTDETRSPDDELRIVIQLLSRAIRSNRGDDISESQLSALIHLRQHGPLTPSELAALEHITPPSMNRTVNGLEEAGLVTRTKSSDDARKVLIENTPAAGELLAEIKRMRTAWFSRRLETLDPAERETVLGVAPILKKLVGP
jgi:DNA-binding MarR family transcriptional regulator